MFDTCLHLHTAERLMDVEEMDQTSHLFFFFFLIIERLMDVQEIESLVQKIKVLLAYHGSI